MYVYVCFYVAQLVLGCFSVLLFCALFHWLVNASLDQWLFLFVVFAFVFARYMFLLLCCSVSLYCLSFSLCLSVQWLVRDSLTLLVLVLFCCFTFNFLFFSRSSYFPPLTAAFLCSPSPFFHDHCIALHFLFLPLSLPLTYTHTSSPPMLVPLTPSHSPATPILNPWPPATGCQTLPSRHKGGNACARPARVLLPFRHPDSSLLCVQWRVWVLQV